ncbi:MAG TPA: hypothetical protein PLB70_08960, partial [Paludibacteraceae bacterium]|nr:hypothetical protein [Paludibacteraceae bacterium]
MARSEPHTAIPILKGTLNHIVRQSIPLGKIVKPWKKRFHSSRKCRKRIKKKNDNPQYGLSKSQSFVVYS